MPDSYNEISSAVGIDKTIFDHLIHFQYSKIWLKKIITFLKENHAYPIKYSPSGKYKLVKIAMNISPFLTKRVIDSIKK